MLVSVIDKIKQLQQSLFSKLDGVCPVDNRPSTDQLHHFVQQEKFTFCSKIVATLEPVL